MKRVLILGGYGTFGGRIADRAVAAGFEVLVAGRSLARAAEFCAGRPGYVPVVVDRENRLLQSLLEHRPFAVVDAAGPFQCSGYEVAQATIEAGCHYLDIADGRAFVTGISALDGAARQAGVAVLSGASSLPALSGAAAAELAKGLDRVTAVEIVLSASSRGTAGRSVTAAILSYLGKPVALRRGQRPHRTYGWQELQRHHFTVAGKSPLRRRLVAIAEVPDLDLLPERLPGRPAVSFLAGTEVGLHNLGLWLLSWPVRWGWIRSASGLTGFLASFQRWTRWAGSYRSAIEVRLFGTKGARRLERRWTLIASRGQGPEIPSLAVPLLLEKLAAGQIDPGARDAGGTLSLEDFRASLAGMASVQEVAETELPPPLYARVMGARFDTLPPVVRQVHEVLRDGGASGVGHVTRGRNPVARLIARFLGFPPEGEHPLHVSFLEREARERWTRDFAGTTFQSELSEREGLLVERFGLLRFGFELPSAAGGLRMEMKRWWLGPIPLPLRLAPRSPAREWEEQGRFHFDVPISLPLVGLLVHYRGWLIPEPAPDDPPMDR